MQSNEKCRNLFGTDASRSSGFNPVDILGELISGDTTHVAIGVSIPSPIMDTFGMGGATVPAVTPSGVPAYVPGRPTTVSITINGSIKSGWMNNNIFSNTLTVLHELAHAYDFIPGAGGSVSTWDWLDQSWESFIIEDCLAVKP
jgi:hypothetical protein